MTYDIYVCLLNISLFDYQDLEMVGCCKKKKKF